MPRSTVVGPVVRVLVLAGVVVGAAGCVVVPGRGYIAGPPVPVVVAPRPIVVAPRPVPVPRRGIYGYGRNGHERYGYDRYGHDRYGHRRW
jgi:hypothetical protein